MTVGDATGGRTSKGRLRPAENGLRLAATSFPASTSSSAGSPASRTPSPGSNWEPTIPDTSGLKQPDLFESFDPVGSALRTSLVCSIQRLGRSWATFVVRATRSGLSWWQLVTWERSTAEADSGSADAWPTPRAEDSESSGERVSRGTADTLTAATRAWPTPTAQDSEEAGGTGRIQAGKRGDSPYTAARNGAATPNPTSTNARCWPSPQAHDAATTTLARSPRWPAGPGQPQHAWEPPRVLCRAQSGVGVDADGLPRGLVRHRRRALAALGNAIVPQVAYAVAHAILEAERGE
jgi:hypothetical protein